MTNEKVHRLQSVDWEFSNYRGFTSYPAEINSLHWYPAPFVPQIPAILIHALTDEGDIVLDPFAGAGVALIEAARLKRKFVGIDINPYAVNIIKAKFYALDIATDEWFSKIEKDVRSLPDIRCSTENYCKDFGIKEEVFKWFEKETLRKLCSLHQYVTSESNNKNKLLKKVLFSSILQKCCSQREHYTYVTDGCYPEKPSVSIDAIQRFLDQAKLIAIAAEFFRKMYEIRYDEEWASPEGIFLTWDARDLGFLRDESIDMVVTSPPYLGVNDYVKSMRLTWLFFLQKGTEEAKENEIGARWKRHRKYAYERYINDMSRSFSEISRVLKPSGFLCFTIGQGRGRVYKGDAKEKLLQILQKKYKFRVAAIFSRKIKFRRIQVQGVGNEDIVVLNRKLG